MAHIIKTLAWRWDRAKCILWGDVMFSDGESFSVGLPLAHVVATFEGFAAENGIVSAPYVGDVDSVDGFFSGLKKLAKKAGGAVSKAVKSTTRVLSQGVQQAAKAAKSVARSKLVGLGVKALAVAVPFVGVPALVAHRAANEALDVYDRARSVARSGARTVQAVNAVRRGQNVVQAVKRLQSSRTPAGRMALAAMRAGVARR